jgi:hypothetical protein
MRETRLSGSEGGAGSIPVPTPIGEFCTANCRGLRRSTSMRFREATCFALG